MKIYNVTNHRLDADLLRKINAFSTDLFGGVIGDSTAGDVFSYDGEQVSINSALLYNDTLPLLGCGCLVSISDSDLPTSIVAGTAYYLQVMLDFSDDSIVSDVPINEDSKIIGVGINQEEIDAYITKPQALIIDGGFRIPLFALYDDVFVSIVQVLDKSSLEDWLSRAALDALWEALHNTFTHQSGSTDDNPNWGKVGNFNVKDSVISHNNANFITSTDENKLQLNSSYVSGAAYVDSNNTLNSSLTLPVNLGGTGADNTAQAKQNLGIYYGTAFPSDTYPTTTPKQGDLYFRILT